MDLLIEDYRVDLNILKLINECFDEMTSIIMTNQNLLVL